MMGSKKGQAVVEFAILLPFFLIFVVILFDFGRFVLDYAILNTAVREGSRMAVVGRSMTDIDNRISDICAPLEDFDPGGIKSYPTGASPNRQIRIEISYNYPPITPGFGTIPLHVQSETHLAPFAQ